MLNIKSLALAACLALISAPAFAWVHGISAQIFTVTCHNIDDSTAINAALDAAIAVEVSGKPAGIYFPTGQCNYKTPHATMIYPVSIYGDGSSLSVINVDTSLVGDVFSWSQTWILTQYGIHVEGITITGIQSAGGRQNGLVLYDRIDFVYMRDVWVYQLNGNCFSAGRHKSTTVGWLRESQFHDLHTWFCGQAGVAAVDLYSENAGGDATNTNRFYNLDIFAPIGPGLLLANANTTKANRYNFFYGLRIESSGSLPSVSDLIDIGDGVGTGGIQAIHFDGVMLINPSSGTAAIKIQSPDATSGAKINLIDFYGLNIGPGAGKGIVINAGSHLQFNFNGFSVSDTFVTVGAAALGVGTPIRFNSDGGNGSIAAWTTSIDATSSTFVFKPTLQAFP